MKNRISLELSFVNSNLQLLKEQLTELNSSVEIYQNDSHETIMPFIPLGLKETIEIDFMEAFLHRVSRYTHQNRIQSKCYMLLVRHMLNLMNCYFHYETCFTRSRTIITKIPMHMWMQSTTYRIPVKQPVHQPEICKVSIYYSDITICSTMSNAVSFHTVGHSIPLAMQIGVVFVLHNIAFVMHDTRINDAHSLLYN